MLSSPKRAYYISYWRYHSTGLSILQMLSFLKKQVVKKVELKYTDREQTRMHRLFYTAGNLSGCLSYFELETYLKGGCLIPGGHRPGVAAHGGRIFWGDHHSFCSYRGTVFAVFAYFPKGGTVYPPAEIFFVVIDLRCLGSHHILSMRIRYLS